jgi:hypothetical protein
LVFSSPLPTALQNGIAKESNADISPSTNSFDYPDGIICEVGLYNTYASNLSQNGTELKSPL